MCAKVAILRSRDHMEALQTRYVGGLESCTHALTCTMTRLPWYLWPVLLVGMLPQYCNGAHANEHTQLWCHANAALKHSTSHYHPSILHFATLQLYPTALPTHPSQRSHRYHKRSSAARLTRVSTCPRKAIAPTARMDRSGSGMSLGLLTWLICFLTSLSLTTIFRSGM